MISLMEYIITILLLNFWGSLNKHLQVLMYTKYVNHLKQFLAVVCGVKLENTTHSFGLEFLLFFKLTALQSEIVPTSREV